MKRLHVLLPARARAGIDEAIGKRLARGDQLPAGATGHAGILEELFSWAGQGFPAAALLRQHACGDAGLDTWMCADPAWVEADINGARMMACGNLGLSMDVAERLAAPLRPLLGDAGVMLELTSGDRWHLRLSRDARPPRFASPDEVLGAQLLPYLEGDARRLWRRLFTEIQTELHDHPANAVRQQRGRQPVNALWFWGAGTLPEWVKTSLGVVASDDPLVRALAHRAGIAVESLDAFAGRDALAHEENLLDLGQGELDGDTWAGLLAWLHGRKADELRLLFADGERISLRRGHRWRFWRRAS